MVEIRSVTQSVQLALNSVRRRILHDKTRSTGAYEPSKQVAGTLPAIHDKTPIMKPWKRNARERGRDIERTYQAPMQLQCQLYSVAAIWGGIMDKVHAGNGALHAATAYGHRSR